MDVDQDMDTEDLVPISGSTSIVELREKLHNRMSLLRRGNAPPTSFKQPPNDKDALIEQRRRERATLRENRRKETKEKIRREAEAKGKKKKPSANAGPSIKVPFTLAL